MRANEAAWYDQHYQQVQESLGAWYAFSLPYLKTIVLPSTRLVDLGCGQGLFLRELARRQWLPEENLYGLDQSQTAVDYVRRALPKAHAAVGDIYHLEYDRNFFNVCLLMETIEHLEDPAPALKQIHTVMAPGGRLLVSYPNFPRLDWRLFRLAAEALGKPQWVVLQPIDKIYRVSQVKRIVEAAGFAFEQGIGSDYGPPYFYRWETDWMTRCLNSLGLWKFSFHPILVFRKSER